MKRHEPLWIQISTQSKEAADLPYAILCIAHFAPWHATVVPWCPIYVMSTRKFPSSLLQACGSSRECTPKMGCHKMDIVMCQCRVVV